MKNTPGRKRSFYPLHSVTIDFVGGRFEGCYFDRDQQRWITWVSHRIETVRSKVDDHFRGCPYYIAVTQTAKRLAEQDTHYLALPIPSPTGHRRIPTGDNRKVEQ